MKVRLYVKYSYCHVCGEKFLADNLPEEGGYIVTLTCKFPACNAGTWGEVTPLQGGNSYLDTFEVRNT